MGGGAGVPGGGNENTGPGGGEYEPNVDLYAVHSAYAEWPFTCPPESAPSNPWRASLAPGK